MMQQWPDMFSSENRPDFERNCPLQCRKVWLAQPKQQANFRTPTAAHIEAKKKLISSHQNMNPLTLLLHSACPNRCVTVVAAIFIPWSHVSLNDQNYHQEINYMHHQIDIDTRAKAVKSSDNKKEERHCQVQLTKNHQLVHIEVACILSQMVALENQKVDKSEVKPKVKCSCVWQFGCCSERVHSVIVLISADKRPTLCSYKNTMTRCRNRIAAPFWQFYFP